MLGFVIPNSSMLDEVLKELFSNGALDRTQRYKIRRVLNEPFYYQQAHFKINEYVQVFQYFSHADDKGSAVHLRSVCNQSINVYVFDISSPFFMPPCSIFQFAKSSDVYSAFWASRTVS
jgi:hypothetical protein